jgi:hypothetical protein
MAQLSFLPGLDTTRLSPRTAAVLSRVLDAAGCPGATISSLVRTPHDQARIMHDNIALHGLAYELAQYAAPGRAVLNVWTTDLHASSKDTIAAMEAEIIRQGASNVSHHCCDPDEKQVADLTDSSLGTYRPAVRAAAAADPSVSLVLDENGCLHIEVPQTDTPVEGA